MILKYLTVVFIISFAKYLICQATESGNKKKKSLNFSDFGLILVVSLGLEPRTH